MKKELLERLIQATKTEEKTTEHLLIKLMEEVGEASEAYLSTSKASGSDYKQLSSVDFQEELVDILLVAFTLLKKTGISEDEMTLLFNKKINKWLEKQGK